MAPQGKGVHLLTEELQDGHSSIVSNTDSEVVEKYFRKPQVRALMLPDPGHMLFDCDLSGADAQVVAWEANEESLKNAFRSGLDIHNFNGTRLWGSTYQPKLVRRKLTWRDECKRGVHGTNYLASQRELARVLGWSPAEVSGFQRAWFGLNPGIQDWQARTDHAVQTTGSVSNRFGFKIKYFDRPSNALPKALAWVPQSTVANVCEFGAVNLHENLPWLEVLLQVHDSVIFQVPFHRMTPTSLGLIHSHLQVTIPYPDPLNIPWGLAISDRNWAKVQKKKWSEML